MKNFKILLFALSLLVMVGCERKPTAQEASETSNAGPVVMTLWTTAEKRFFDSLTNEFVAQTGAPLRFKVVEFEDELEMQQVLVNALAEGEGPDVIYTDGEWIAGNPKKLTLAKPDPAFTHGNFESTFVQSANEALLAGESDILGVPMAIDSLALIYNEEHIADRLPDRNTPASTWELLRDDATALSRTDNSFERFAVSGIALGRTDNIKYGAEIIENLMLQSGVQFFDESNTLATFDNTETALAGGRTLNAGEESINYYTSFADERYRNYSWNSLLAKSEGNEKDLRTFAKGKTSMVIAKSKDLPLLQSIINDLESSDQPFINDQNIRVTFLPQIDDPQLSPNRKVVADIKALAVTRDSRYPDTAWRFLKFAISRDNLQKWHEETLMPSPRLDLLLEQEQVPLVGIYVRQAKFARANLMPVPKMYFYEALRPNVEAINAGRMSTSKALENAAMTVTNILQNDIARRAAIER